MKILFVCLLLFSITLPSFSQKCELCGQSLNDGVRDEFNRNTNLNYENSLNILFTKDYSFWSNYENYSQKNSSLDTGFSLFKILDGSTNFESENTNQTKRQQFENLRTQYTKNHKISLDLKESVSKRVASSVLLGAWLDCMKGCDGSNKFNLSHSPISDEQFIITLNRFTSDAIGEKSTFIESILFTNAKFNGGTLRRSGAIAKGGALTASFTRKNKLEDVTITVVIKNAGAKQIVIGKFIEPPKITYCEETPQTFTPADRFYMPPFVSGGDREYNGHGPIIKCSGNLIVSSDRRTINVRIFMDAVETEDNWTRASGTFEEQIFAVPSGYVILRIDTPTTYDFGYTDGDHNDNGFAGNGFIRNAIYRGDRKGNDAGQWTAVTLQYNPITVTLQQCCNCTPK